MVCGPPLVCHLQPRLFSFAGKRHHEGGDIAPAIDETVFDDLFVVTVYAKGKAKVAHLKQ
jgi:hypothetical protein